MSSKFFLSSAAAGVMLAVPFLLPPLFALSWICLIPFFWALTGARSLRQAFFLGWIAGAISNLLGFYWLDYTIGVFGGFPHGLSELIFLLFAASSALQLALFAVLVHLSGWGLCYLFPALFWVAIELWFPLLFPWHLANSQSEFLTFIQSADLVGPYGASFLLVWLNTVLYAAVFSSDRRAKLFVPAALLSAVLIGTLAYGFFRLKSVDREMKAARTLSVAAIQGGVDIQYKWNTAYLESNMRSHLALTEKARQVDLIIWPESAVEDWVAENIDQMPPRIVPKMEADSFLIFGARSFRGNPMSRDLKAFNSAFLMNAQGRVLGRYHKQVLLAFGEYIPFAGTLARLFGDFIPIPVGFAAGEGPSTLDLPAGIRVAPLICYEDLMPRLARRFVSEKGANLLVNLTNDAWYGDSAAQWQHARIAQWRAIETRRSLVRATNTGVTTVINPRGDLFEALPTFSPGILKAKVQIMEGETLYVKYGDWFAWVIAVGSVAIVLKRLRDLIFHGATIP